VTGVEIVECTSHTSWYRPALCTVIWPVKIDAVKLTSDSVSTASHRFRFAHEVVSVCAVDPPTVASSHDGLRPRAESRKLIVDTP
jgi:hypothetical protein